jgi:hypothetical protein
MRLSADAISQKMTARYALPITQEKTTASGFGVTKIRFNRAPAAMLYASN